MHSRTSNLQHLDEASFDVLVVGGGITGAGVALDAASRGLSVALVERGDYACGTSSRSSKLIHGGLRYLQNLDFALVREALVERRINTRMAPHLVRPVELVVPVLAGRRDARTAVGLSLYDAMSFDSSSWRRSGLEQHALGRHRVLSGNEVAERLPALAARSPKSGYLLYDGQTDDVRLVLAVLQAADSFGAVCANQVNVTGLAIDSASRVTGAHAVDRVSDASFQIRARHVVNATGVWADDLQPPDVTTPFAIRPSRGTHLIFDSDDLHVRAGAIIPAGGDRTIFVLPWLGSTLVGTTDADYAGSTASVPAADVDIDYLLSALNSFFGCDLSPAHVAGAFAGVRPLISEPGRTRSTEVSRRALLDDTGRGLLTITGGKYTTWRRMAQDTVDRMLANDGRRARCRTASLLLGQLIEPGGLLRVSGVADDAYGHLAGRYGAAARDVLALAEQDRSLCERVVPGQPDLLAEVVYAARHEHAQHLDDVLLRRTRLGLLKARELVTRPHALLDVSRVMGREQDWDAHRVGLEAEAFVNTVQRENLAPGLVTATTA